MKTANLKTKMTTRYVKYFTKELLQEAARSAEKWDFNRQLSQEAMDALPSNGRYRVELWLTHQHRHGEPAEEHIRAQVAMNAAPKGGVAFVDMPVEFWDRLPAYPVRIRKAVARYMSAGSGSGRWGSIVGYNPCGEPEFQEWRRREIERNKETELSPDACKTLTQVFQDYGAEWTYETLGRFYLPPAEMAKLKANWKDERQLAAVMTLGEIFQSYTRTAIYDAATAIEKPAEMIADKELSTGAAA